MRFLCGIVASFMCVFCWGYPNPQALDTECSALFLHDHAWLDAQYTTYAEIKKIAHNKRIIKEIFTHVSALSQKIEKSTSIGKEEGNIRKNRNAHFLPFDCNIPCRGLLDCDAGADFYINGSEVITSEQNYLLMQAPLETTLSDFWRVLIIKKCPVIVTTATPYEGKGKSEKCTPYWLMPKPREVDGWTIERTGDDEIIAQDPRAHSERIVKRLFLLRNTKTEETRTYYTIAL